MIYCRARICYVISDLNLTDVMALLHSLGVGKRLCIALGFHKIYRLVQYKGALKKSWLRPTLLEGFWGAWASV